MVTGWHIFYLEKMPKKKCGLTFQTFADNVSLVCFDKQHQCNVVSIDKDESILIKSRPSINSNWMDEIKQTTAKIVFRSQSFPPERHLLFLIYLASGLIQSGFTEYHELFEPCEVWIIFHRSLHGVDYQYDNYPDSASHWDMAIKSRNSAITCKTKSKIKLAPQHVATSFNLSQMLSPEWVCPSILCPQ